MLTNFDFFISHYFWSEPRKLIDKFKMQVKFWLRQLEKPIDGVGNKPIAIRGAVTTMADASDFIHDIGLLNITAQRKKNIR